MTLSITLMAAGAAALINLWLAIRCGQVRTTEKILVGDGGNMKLIARMRAHSNFVENTPFVLILIGLVEYAAGSSMWLYVVAVVFLLGRVAHGFGMDGWRIGRMVGTLTTMLTLLGLGIYALALPYIGPHHGAVTEIVQTR